ncbi:hypothetical protein JKG47_06290 [Acidithiobacillus sp. MC6.1]|nr:hypothetical protein [Acidithiobacillus sp. MC6.1]
MTLHEVGLVFYGALFALVVDFLRRFRRRYRANRKRADAGAVLKSHGLTPVLYVPTVGIADPALRNAMDEFSFSGHIIMNAEGQVVGKIAGTAQQRPHPRLVASND